jgi:type II secretory pathway pseudopilin PulG
LIELLIVMSIMVIIAALGFLFLPNLSRNKGVANATTQSEGWIRLSKQQALKDGSPRGIRLIQDANDPTRVTSAQFIEQPEPIAPRGAGVRIAITTPNPNAMGPPPFPNPMPATVRLESDPTGMGTYQPLAWDGVQMGDYFELSSGPQGFWRIIAPPGGIGSSELTLERGVEGTEPAPYGNTLYLSAGFRVIRSPRPLQGEPLLQMNKDVYIDLLNCYPCPLPLGPQVPPGPAPYGNHFTAYQPWSPSGNLDILFNSSGQVANAPRGQIILCVQHVDRPSDKLLIVIYTRTGKVSAVNWNDVYHPVNTPNVNPYSMALDGKSSGL